MKNSFPCNIHTCHPLSYDWGQKRRIITPEKTGGTAYRGTTGSTVNSLSHDSTDCKGKEPGHDRLAAGHVPVFRHLSYDFSIKWLTPFYPANPSQAAGGGEKCMDLRFLRLRRWLLKQQPDKTGFNRFIKNEYQSIFLSPSYSSLKDFCPTHLPKESSLFSPNSSRKHFAISSTVCSRAVKNCW